jgi:hypothetical protein
MRSAAVTVDSTDLTKVVDSDAGSPVGGDPWAVRFRTVLKRNSLAWIGIDEQRFSIALLVGVYVNRPLCACD